MATSIDDLVREAYLLLNVISEAENLSAEQLSYGISNANRMFSMWNTDGVSTYSLKQQYFTLTPGTSEYTIGSGGTINTARPIRITSAFVRNGTTDYPIEIIDVNKWMGIPNKQDTAVIPQYLYYEPNFPLGKIYLNYVPSSALVVYYSSENQITSTYVSGDAVSFPPGYEEAIIFNLAKKLWPRYPSQAAYAAIKEQAQESLAMLQNLNFKQSITEADLDYRLYKYTDKRIFDVV